MSIFSSIPPVIRDLRSGKMVIVIDSPSRENQGDLIFSADTVTAQKINFMMQNCKGLICVAITQKRAIELDLPLMIEPVKNTEKTKVNFTTSIDAYDVTSFGISAKDKEKTTKIIADQRTKPADLVRPGHVFPLIAAEGGLLARQGHTEAAVTLSRLAGFTPTGVLCEILDKNGNVADLSYLVRFSRKFKIKIISINDLLKYIKIQPRQKTVLVPSIIRKAEAKLPTRFGTFQIVVYKSILDEREHAALIMGKNLKSPVLTRIHSQCLTGDTFFSLRCDCREQLHQSMKIISEQKEGLIIYLSQEGRGIGLSNKIKAYALQEKGLDTVEANLALHLPIDARDYRIAAEILQDLGASQVSLLTNNPSKINHLTSFGITIDRQIPLEVFPNKLNRDYLRIKKQKLGHLLTKI